ncbi:P-loop containing nucleoside triphosphate hydrolase protein [Syncephalis fuscata]|nr:P-loop containing nucleoside triphosphate hydrolase protein [Syncephalis fuscata]
MVAVLNTQNDTMQAERKRSRKKRGPGKRAREQMANNEQQAASNEQQTTSSEFIGGSHLSWKQVTAPSGIIHGDDNLGGFLCLEEVDDVECLWEGDDNTGRVCRFKARSTKSDTKNNVSLMAQHETPLTEEEMQGFIHIDDFVEEAEPVPSKKPKTKPLVVANHEQNTEKPDTTKNKTKTKKATNEYETAKEANNSSAKTTADGSAWDNLGLVQPLVETLKTLGYTQPTRIQAETLPFSLKKQDIIGAAETGSGKTLAFGLPILQYLAKLPDLEARGSRGLSALILAPTRELAIQVKDHLVAVSQQLSVKVAVIVGGMSVQKQERMLKQHPDILVATPGRLWEIMSENDDYRAHIRRLRFLVLDEADRMLESGHFKELEFILSAISLKEKTSEWHASDKVASSDAETKHKRPSRRQTFIFSATLNHNLQLHKRGAKNQKKAESSAKASEANLQNLLDRIEFSSAEPKVVDVTRAEAVAESLVEVRIDCLKEDKDLYLYYFLCRYPGRTLIFTNSIDCIRRILPLFKLLRINVYGLHAQMQQRQRLKNVDRFKSDERAVLIASDVAARGLDIPFVEHVIHYQLPRSGEIYVHRSGRTARAGREGISAMLCSPDELTSYRKLCQVLKKHNGIPEFPVDQIIVAELKKRIQLAKQIDKQEHSVQKRRHDDEWLIKHAEMMDIELDDTIHTKRKGGASHIADDDNEESIEQQARQKAKVQKLKQQLDQMLSQSLVPRGSSGRYLTSGVVRDLAERLLNADQKDALPTIDKTSAIHDAKVLKRKRRRGEQ